MISTIVALGSSATKGYGILPAQTWPAHLEALLCERGRHIQVFNRATHGLAVQAIAERVLHLAGTMQPDLYVIQLPVPGRLYLGINGGSPTRESHFSKDVVLGWSEKLAGISPTRLLLDHNVISPESSFHYVLDKYYYPLVRRNNAAITNDTFHAFLCFWHEAVAKSDLELISYAKEVVLLQLLFRHIGKPYIMLEWIYFRLKKHAADLQPFFAAIDFRHFVAAGEHTVYDCLKERRPLDFETLLHDQYGHLNNAGNQFVAEDLIYPALSCLLDAS